MRWSTFIGLALFAMAGWIQFGGSSLVSSAPFPTDKLSVLIVEETEDRDDLPTSQVSAIESAVWRGYVLEKGGNVRVLEPEAKLSNEDPWVAPALAVKRDSVPWLVISDGKRGYSGPLPENLDGLMAKLREIGG